MGSRRHSKDVMTISLVVVIGAGMSWAGSQGGYRLGSLPVFALAGMLAFAINWLAFIPAAIRRTEHFFDLIGGVTYLSVVVGAATLSSHLDLRAALVTAMVTIWAVRLSSFLFLRISKSGGDRRFDDIKTQPLRFLATWTLQALWVLLTASAALAVITTEVREPLGILGIAGCVVWVIGFAIEVVADHQKSSFRRTSAKSRAFITHGLWAWSRHPNYFGEIVLWTGVAIVALPVLEGWQNATLISPLFVAVLLIKVSGIPMLQKRADERWGNDNEYLAYRRRTPMLIPRPPKRGTT